MPEWRCDWTDLHLWAVLWSTAGQTSEIHTNILLFLTAPWISDNGSSWIYTDWKLVKKSYKESNFCAGGLKVIFFFFSCVDRATNTFLLHLWNVEDKDSSFFLHNLLSYTSVCIACCWNKELGWNVGSETHLFCEREDTVKHSKKSQQTIKWQYSQTTCTLMMIDVIQTPNVKWLCYFFSLHFYRFLRSSLLC